MSADLRVRLRTATGTYLPLDLIEQWDTGEIQKMLTTGRLVDDQGQEVTGVRFERAMTRLLGDEWEPPLDTLDDEGDENLLPAFPYPMSLYEHERSGLCATERRYLIPGLWAEGTKPALSGNPKAGKTKFVVDLSASLLVPGRRFLNHFDPCPLEDDERSRTLWLINPETPKEDMTAALSRAFQGDARSDLLMVDHLDDDLGGAQMFDLTDDRVYREWVDRLHQTEGSAQPYTPFAVIVDGVTAILQANGKGVEWYPKWYARFKALLRETQVPSGLAVFHATLTGNHMMGGTEALAGPDGLWTYSSSNVDSPSASRWFSVLPRIGGTAVPQMPVTMGEDGMLTTTRTAASKSPEALPAAPDPVDEVMRRTAEYVKAHPGVDGEQLSLNVAADNKAQNLEGRARAVQGGLIVKTDCAHPCSPCAASGRRAHHRRSHYWPPA